MTSVSSSNMVHVGSKAGPSRSVAKSVNEPISCNWKLAKQGISLLINNKEREAIALFESNLECLEMFAGYATTLFMKGISTFEDDKIDNAMVALHDLENRCSHNKTRGWFQKFRSTSAEVSDVQRLEMDICMGDAQMYLSILTFIGHDFKSYFHGGWLMRKALKTYQRTYDEITHLYRPSPLVDSINRNKTSASKLDQSMISIAQITSETKKVPNANISARSTDTKNTIGTEVIRLKSKLDGLTITKPIECNTNDIHKNIEPTNSENAEFEEHRNDTDVTSATSSDAIQFEIIESTTKNVLFEQNQLNNVEANGNMTTDYELIDQNTELVSVDEVDYNTPKDIPIISNGNRDIDNDGKHKLKESFTRLTSLLFLNDSKRQRHQKQHNQIDDETVVRLLKGVSFGYGLMQLGLSLLPPSILKLTSIFGFHGKHQTGLTNLEFAKTGTDMRAPLATLALLWYHTIARPFYAVDGLTIQAGILSAKQLLDENKNEYADSAFFLYFRGRIARLQSNLPEAIISLNECINNSEQREMKLIAMHEIGWCYMIRLNYEMAIEIFIELQLKSRWAKAFYTYLAYLCSSITNPSDSVKEFERVETIFKNYQRCTPLDEFLKRRYKIMLTQYGEKPEAYWQLLFFEVLYLWNTLACVSQENIMGIIKVCEEECKNPEPMIGLAYLLMGCCYSILKDWNKAKVTFRTGLEIRGNLNNAAEDCHVSAFTLYELGQLLIRDTATRREGIELLQQTHNYKNYDFDQRLSFRVNAILKRKL